MMSVSRSAVTRAERVPGGLGVRCAKVARELLQSVFALASATVLLGTVACSDAGGALASGASEVDAADEVRGSVEVGTGSPFLSLADGDTLPLILGTQGGYHVYVSLRVAGVNPRGDLAIELRGNTGELLAGPLRLRLSAEVVRDSEFAGAWERHNDLLILDVPVARVDQQDVLLTIVFAGDTVSRRLHARIL